MLTLDQAIRNAIETELAAARFYSRLNDKTTDKCARVFLTGMVTQEEHHAASLQALSKKLVAGKLPLRADQNVEQVEASPQWIGADAVSLLDAVTLAVEAEQRAALYYDALADSVKDEAIKTLFRGLVQAEEGHARQLGAFLHALEK